MAHENIKEECYNSYDIRNEKLLFEVDEFELPFEHELIPISKTNSLELPRTEVSNEEGPASYTSLDLTLEALTITDNPNTFTCESITKLDDILDDPQGSHHHILISLSSSPYRNQLMPEKSLWHDINQFSLEGFAKNHFALHKKGILIRKKVPMWELLRWTNDCSNIPLMNLHKDLHKEAMHCFKNIQKIMKDRPISNKNNEKEQDLLCDIIKICINVGDLRDEVYVQLCKQLSHNGNKESLQKGWEIMSLCVNSFLPSKNFEDYLKSFIKEKLLNTDDKISKSATYCLNRLEKNSSSNGGFHTLKIPSNIDIERSKEAPYLCLNFGESLENIMSFELSKDPFCSIPYILVFLRNCLLKHEGHKIEGIFRVSGDVDIIAKLKWKLDKREYNEVVKELEVFGNRTTVHIVSSLIKTWVRELKYSLIPDDVYHDCIHYANDAAQCIEILYRLPTYHAAVLKYILELLQFLGHPTNIEYTKMSYKNLAMVFAPNCLRCTSDNPLLILSNAGLETQFINTLLENYIPLIDSYKF